MQPVAVVRNWLKYALPHAMHGRLNEEDFDAFGCAQLTFGDGSVIVIDDPAAVILTGMPADEIPE